MALGDSRKSVANVLIGVRSTSPYQCALMVADSRIVSLIRCYSQSQDDFTQIGVENSANTPHPSSWAVISYLMQCITFYIMALRKHQPMQQPFTNITNYPIWSVL
jgi:hypothetical protein